MSRLLLICGMIAAPLFILTDIVAAVWLYPGYDITSQQVSELSAIGAPSRDFWMLMSYPYFAATAAFAIGLWLSAAGRRSLQVTAILIGLFAINSLLWGFVAPMHMRGATFTDTDTMHLLFAVSAVALIAAFSCAGAISQGGRFRLYSAITLVLILAAGGLVSTSIEAIANNQLTPWMGLLERISVYGPLIWMAVLAGTLLRQRRESTA